MGWKDSLRTAVRDPDELLEILGLAASYREGARRAAARFPLVVPRDFILRMAQGDATDPLLRQVLPLAEELKTVAGFVADPVGDRASEVAPGLLKKYSGRALLITAGFCAVNCRYCFRREYPYEAALAGDPDHAAAVAAVAADPLIEEVILSGGDPLVLSDSAIGRLVERLAAIPHLRRLRVHSRLPIVLPDRVTDELLAILTGTRLAPFFVVHANHARELAGECAQALARIVRAGIPLLNQAVLLRGVNDDAESQVALCKRLLELRAVPYYLHQLDPVRGAAHFFVPEPRGLEIYAEMRRRLPGYGLPRYVRELPGGESKVPIA